MTLARCRCVGLELCLSCEIAAMRRRHAMRRAVAAGVHPNRARAIAAQRYPSEPATRRKVRP